MTFIPPQPLSRRTFLRGVGVTMALPWLESIPVWGDGKPKTASSEPPVRFAVLFSGHGYHSRAWWATGEGKGMQPGKVLEPALAFDRLYRDEVGKADKSVLDAVREDATSYKNKVSKSDQRRLDEYL